MSDRQSRTGLFEMPNEPEIEDLFPIQLREASLQLKTHSIARVVAYDPVTQTVQPWTVMVAPTAGAPSGSSSLPVRVQPLSS